MPNTLTNTLFRQRNWSKIFEWKGNYINLIDHCSQRALPCSNKRDGNGITELVIRNEVSGCHKGQSSFLYKTPRISNLAKDTVIIIRGEILQNAAFAILEEWQLPPAGEGVWFESGPDEITFLDGPDDVGDRRAGPAPMNHK